MQFLVLLLTVIAKIILLRIDVTTQARRHRAGIGVVRGGARGPGSPAIEMLPMIKM